MHLNDFGTTGLRVSTLGFGASPIGNHSLDDDNTGAVFNRALDLGINLIDTSHCYGDSEERIGRYVGHRRDEYVLSSKCGHGCPGVEDWTPECVRTCVETSLRRLRTDHIDVMYLHSCDKEKLADGRLADTLDELVAAGKIGIAAYSGDNEHLAFAVESGRFAALQTSVNIADQWSLHNVLPTAAERGLGVLAKRPIANAAFTYDQRPTGVYGENYWVRLQELDYDYGMDPLEFALRWSAFAPGVSSAIMGTTKVANLENAVRIIEAGPLPDDVLAHVEQRWTAVGQGWRGET